jgi:ectoine hydroxylase-related dioxygenase (phytanoyl-CoA dioxygenase family)
MTRVLSERELASHEQALSRRGYAIVEALISPQEADAVAAALQPLQDAAPFGANEFVGLRTRRVFNLFAKTRALDDLAMNPDVLRLTRSLLGPSIQLSIASTMEIFPGETAQALHQDDAYWKFGNPHPAFVLNTMWALTPFTEANGATRLAPGSNAWRRPAKSDEATVAAVMPKGSVLLWDGAVWHGGGANQSDEVRFGVSLNFCRGWVRQQENQYLALGEDLARRLPADLQRLLGWDNSEFLGFVDGAHPLQRLRDLGTSY